MGGGRDGAASDPSGVRRSFAVCMLASLLAGCFPVAPSTDDIVEEARGHREGSRREVCYAYLDGSESDAERGIAWCRSIAEQGDVNAQALLGEIYLSGRPPVERDYDEALRWLEAAGYGGHAHAQYLVGSMYERGLGVERDPALAREWYEHSAAQDYTAAREALGRSGPIVEDEAAAPGCPRVPRSLREQTDTAVRDGRITGAEWICRVAALDALDGELRLACASGDLSGGALAEVPERLAACRQAPGERTE